MKKICEYCGAESAPGMHKRWHGENCKQKPSSNQCHVDDESDIPSIKNPKSLLSNGENKMSTFVEVHSLEKNCQVIINLDHIVEIAPLKDGGCILYMADSAGVNARQGIRVRDDYKLFTQFAMQTVTGDMIAERIQSIQASIDPAPKTTKKDKKSSIVGDLEIPVFK